MCSLSAVPPWRLRWCPLRSWIVAALIVVGWPASGLAGDDGMRGEVGAAMAGALAETMPRPYRGLSHTSATWVYRRANPDQSIRVRRSTTNAAADGRLGNVNYESIEGKPGPGDQFAKYFVYREGLKLWCAYAEGSRYTETMLTNEPDILDPAPQLAFAPWARVDAWLDEMERRGARSLPLGAGRRLSAAQADGGTFSLEFGAQGELTGIEKDRGEAKLRWEFFDFHDVQGRPIPSRLHESRVVTKDGSTTVASEAWAQLEKFDSDTPEALEAIRFDPVRLNVRYFDEATGDVYSPDKSHKLFTINQEGHAISPWWSRTWLLGVIGAAAVSLGIMWRRWVRR